MTRDQVFVGKRVILHGSCVDMAEMRPGTIIKLNKESIEIAWDHPEWFQSTTWMNSSLYCIDEHP